MIHVFKIESNQFSLFLHIVDSSLYQLTKLTKPRERIFFTIFPFLFLSRTIRLRNEAHRRCAKEKISPRIQ